VPKLELPYFRTKISGRLRGGGGREERGREKKGKTRIIGCHWQTVVHSVFARAECKGPEEKKRARSTTCRRPNVKFASLATLPRALKALLGGMRSHKKRGEGKKKKGALTTGSCSTPALLCVRFLAAQIRATIRERKRRGRGGGRKKEKKRGGRARIVALHSRARKSDGILAPCVEHLPWSPGGEKKREGGRKGGGSADGHELYRDTVANRNPSDSACSARGYRGRGREERKKKKRSHGGALESLRPFNSSRA